MLQNQYHTYFKVVQSDGGGEFLNHSLMSYFISHGIIHCLSCPGTPKQNGMAEQRHRHIIDIDLILMAHSSLTL